MLTGFACGFSLPFVVGGTAAGVYNLSRHSDGAGFATVISIPVTTITWVAGGYKLARFSEITVPERYRAEIGERDWASFSKGYIDVASGKRTGRYIHGVVAGSVVCVGTTLYIISRLLADFNGFGGV